jgi:RNA polymerase sigma factor (sigma-70 family)
MASGVESQTGTTLHFLLRDPKNAQAWKRFVERYGGKIAGWCRKWRLQDADVQEVTQNVLLKLLQGLRTYDAGHSFRAWLKTVTHNALVDYLKRTARAGQGTGDSQVAQILGSVPARDDLFMQLDQEFERELLEQAMARVRPRVHPDTWKAFEWTALGKQAGSEVAAQLNMTVDAVFKARSRVQQMLKHEIHKLDGVSED